VTTGETPATHPSRSHRALIGVALLLFAAASAYLALVIVTRVDHIFSPFQQVTIPGPIENVPLPGVDKEGDSGPQERINILVMGLDRRARDGEIASRTDTIFIVTADPKTDTTAMLGIPRDLLVDIPYRDGSCCYEDRVNTVYVAGELNGYKQGGIDLMKEVIQRNFDIEIDKHVIVDFEGFEEIIDALGGVEVDVPEAIADPRYSITEKPGDYFPVSFKPGLQHMDGKHALAYARIRFGSDDFDRIQRQQRVIFAAIAKAKSLDVLKNAPSLWSKYKDTINTDISDIQIGSYAILANRVKDNLTAVSLAPVTVPYTTPQGAAVLVADWDAVAQIVDAMFSDKPLPTDLVEQPTDEPVRVQIQNGAGVEGLAADVVNFMVTNGYSLDDVTPANVYDGETHETSEIIDLDGSNLGNAYAIAERLGIPSERVREATPEEKAAMADANANIIVILGTDFDYDSNIRSPETRTPGG